MRSCKQIAITLKIKAGNKAQASEKAFSGVVVETFKSTDAAPEKRRPHQNETGSAQKATPLMASCLAHFSMETSRRQMKSSPYSLVSKHLL